jgi:hypothetical protein
VQGPGGHSVLGTWASGHVALVRVQVAGSQSHLPLPYPQHVRAVAVRVCLANPRGYRKRIAGISCSVKDVGIARGISELPTNSGELSTNSDT